MLTAQHAIWNIWIKMKNLTLQLVIFKHSTSKIKLSTICKVQLCPTLACRLKGNNSAMTYIFVVLDLLVYVCAWNVSKATPWRTNRNKKTAKVNIIARLFTLKKKYWSRFSILNQQKQYIYIIFRLPEAFSPTLFLWIWIKTKPKMFCSLHIHF